MFSAYVAMLSGTDRLVSTLPVAPKMQAELAAVLMWTPRGVPHLRL